MVIEAYQYRHLLHQWIDEIPDENIPLLERLTEIIRQTGIPDHEADLIAEIERRIANLPHQKSYTREAVRAEIFNRRSK